MDSDEQAQAYASADFSDANKIFLSNMLSVSSSLHGKAILDVGCGDGEIIIDIKKRFDCNLTAIDGSASMLKQFLLKSVKNNIQDVSVINERIEKHPFKNNTFDFVICNSLLHHVKDPQLFWERVIDITKPGGYVFAMDLVRPHNLMSLNNILQKHGNDNQVLMKDFKNSLMAAYTVNEVEKQISIFKGIK
jgi:ubiquinone/menaquinone biosynthesis C-methylase UbiE